MPKPDSAYVRCICCVRGRYGNRSCGAGWNATDESSGCFNGAIRPTKHAQKKNAAINERDFSNLNYPEGVTWQGPVKKARLCIVCGTTCPDRCECWKCAGAFCDVHYDAHFASCPTKAQEAHS